MTVKSQLPVAVILVGAFGGMAPCLLRIGTKLMSGWAPDVTYALTYTVGLVIFGLIGAGVAAVWGETDLKKVAYLGIGLPSLLQLTAGDISSKVAVDLASGVVAPAYAQAAPAPAVRRTLTLRPSQMALQNQRVVVAFVDSAGRRSNEIALPQNAKPTTFLVPATATNVVLSSPECDARATTFDLPASGASRLDVELARNPWAGFLAALGFRDVRPVFVVAKPEQVK
jgi:hypothetical protein